MDFNLFPRDVFNKRILVYTEQSISFKVFPSAEDNLCREAGEMCVFYRVTAGGFVWKGQHQPVSCICRIINCCKKYFLLNLD